MAINHCKTLLFLVFYLCSSGIGYAESYKCVEEDGSTTFTDMPCPQGSKSIVNRDHWMVTKDAKEAKEERAEKIKFADNAKALRRAIRNNTAYSSKMISTIRIMTFQCLMYDISQVYEKECRLAEKYKQ